MHIQQVETHNASDVGSNHSANETGSLGGIPVNEKDNAVEDTYVSKDS